MSSLIAHHLVKLVSAALGAIVSSLLLAQSFTHTIGGMNAQDGIGAWHAAEGYRIAMRAYAGVPHAFTGSILSASSSGMINGTTMLDTGENTFIQNVVDHPDGGAFLVGSILRGNPNVHDALTARVSMAGVIQWFSAPAQSGAQQFFGGTALSDGGAVFCGVSDAGNGHQPLIVRYSANGDVLWSYVGSGATDAEAYGVALEGDALIVTGRVANYSGFDDMLALRLTLDGEPVWTSAFGGAGSDMGRAVKATGDGAFLIAGWTNSFGTFDHSSQRTPFHGYLLALDLEGDTLWTRTIGDTLFDLRIHAMERLADGDLYLAGERGTSALSDAILLRTSPNGTPIWQRVLDLGKEERITHLHRMTDGVLATGWAFGDFGRQVLFVHRDLNGN